MRRAVLRCVNKTAPLPFSKARRILVVSKVTRYEYELSQLAALHGPVRAEAFMRDAADRQGSDLEWLSRTHEVHEAAVQTLIRGLGALPSVGSVQVVKCYGDLKREHIANADFIFSMGGDGTFLRTASFIQDFGKAPLLCGINTDPLRSAGNLCINHGASKMTAESHSLRGMGAPFMGQADKVVDFLDQLLSGDVQYITRQRIRVTTEPACEKGAGSAGEGHHLLALNDVLVAELEAQKASYYELRFTDSPAGNSAEQLTVEKQKSSGLLVSTGTGSTAWSRSVTSIQPTMIKKILDLMKGETLPGSLSPDQISEELRQSLVFAPDSQKMHFVVREPIINGVFTCDHSSGLARSISVRSRSPGLHIFADGQLTAPLPLNHVATFTIHSEDALRAVHLVGAGA